MSEVSKDSKRNKSEVRAAFPDACKWFDKGTGKPASDMAASEVTERFQRSQDGSSSPCNNCPLCPGH